MTPRDPNASSGGSRKPNSGRGGWRKGATPAAARSSASASRSWWSARPKEQPQKSSFRAKLALSLIAMTVLIGAFVAVLMNFRDQVPFIAIGVTDYSSKLLPPNAWTKEDFQRFDEIADDNAVGMPWFGAEGRSEIEFKDQSALWGESTGSESLSETALSRLGDVLKRVRPGGPAKSVILYVSAHGVVNEQGEPCLLLRESDPRRSATWLEVKDLLLAFCSECSQANTKVLVLDSGRMETNAACGLLYQDFAERLEHLVTQRVSEKDHKGLVVVNSTSDVQIGWAAPERAGTVFGYYLCQALCGAADIDQRGSVSFEELKEYLERSVSGYTSHYRDSIQRPMVLTTDDGSGTLELQLTHCSARKLSDEELRAEQERLDDAQKVWNNADDWARVHRLWKDHDRLKESTPPIYRYEPVGWASFERRLLRLEQLLLAGSAYAEEYKSLVKDTWADNHRLAQAANIAAYNLPLLGRQSPPAAAESTASSEPKPKVRPYGELAKIAWDQLLSADAITPSDLAVKLAPLEAGPPGQRPEPIEIHFSRMLAKYLDQPGPPPELLHTALQSRQKAETSASPLDERTQYWIRATVDEGDSLRRLAEDLLFVGPEDSNAPNPWLAFEKLKWQNADQKYQTATDNANLVSQALLLRDRAATELPYLADWAWQSLWGSSNETQALGPDRVEKVNKAIHAWHAVCRELGGEQAGNPAVVQGMTEQRKALEQLLDGLSSEFEKEELGIDGGSQSKVRDIQWHLSFPLVKGSDRERLRGEFLNELVKFSDQLKRGTDGAETVATKETSKTPTDRRHPFLEWLDESKQAVSDTSPPIGKDSEFSVEMDKQGGRVRELLVAAKETVRDAPEKFRETLRGKSSPSDTTGLTPQEVIELRQILSNADLTARTVAGWQDQLPDPNESESGIDGVYAIDALRRFDLQQLMLWQARRTLDDFWDSLPGKTGSEVKPYFAAVAEEYLRAAAAQGSKGGRDRGEGRFRVDCQTLLEKRLQGVSYLPQIPAQRVERSEESPAVDLPLKLVQTPEQGKTPGLPPGIAAAFVHSTASLKSEPLTEKDLSSSSSPKKALSVNRLAVDLGLKEPLAAAGIAKFATIGTSETFEFKPSPNTTSLEAVVWYRGHAAPNPIEIMPPGVQIVYAPDKVEPASVRVSGKETMPTSVMFILDCSFSMNDRDVPPDKAGDAPRQRFDVARGTLTNILNDQALGQFRVGMRLYGHRVGKNMAADVATLGRYRFSDYAMKQQKAKLPMPAHPGEDVELTHRVDQFNDRLREEMISTLKQVGPFGITPLYLSIAKAADDPIPPDEQRRIIAITDGRNYQDDVGGASVVTLERLKAALKKKRSQVAIDIIGFGNEINDRENVDALKEMQKLAEDHGGRYYPAKNALDLLDSIKASLRIGKFKVVPQEPAGPTETFALDAVPGWREAESKRLAQGSREIKYNVDVVGIKDSVDPMPIALHGGEAMELVVERDGRVPKLMYPGYYSDGHRLKIQDPTDPRATLSQHGVFVAESGTGAEYWVSPGRPPDWRDQPPKAAKFFIQIQDLNRTRFTPRPAEAWIEIRSAFDGSKDASAEVFRFCDLNFVGGKPVPQIVCEAREFPWTTASDALVEIWYANEPVTDDVRIVTVDDLLRKPERIDDVLLTARIEQRTGRPTRTLTIEEQGAKSPGRVKIHLETPVPQIRHNYSTGKHYYELPTDVDLKQCDVRLISVERFKNNAKVLWAKLPPQRVGKQ